MAWRVKTSLGVEIVHRIIGQMNAKHYVNILDNLLIPPFDLFAIKKEDKIVFQQDNDPKHTLLLVKYWLLRNYISALNWPTQSLDFNRIMNLWFKTD